MAISLVQSKAGVSASATTNPSFDSAPTSGNLVVLCFASDDYNGTPDSGWTQSAEMEQQTYHGGYIWWRISDGSNPPGGYTIGSATVSAWHLSEWSGCDAAPYDTSQGQFNQSTSGSYTTATITPSTGDRVLVAMFGGSQADGTTGDLTNWTNSFTDIGGAQTTAGATDDLIGVAYRLVTGDGSTTFSTGADYGQAQQSQTGLIISFKADGGPPPAGTLLGTLTANGGSQVNPSPINGSVAVSIGDLVYAVWSQQTNLTVGTGPANPSDNLGNTYAWCNAGTDPGTPTARAGWSVVTTAGTLTQITAAATASTNNYANFAAVIKGPFQANANQPDANPENGSDNTSPFACPATGTLAQADEVIMCFWVGATSATQAASSPNLLAGQAVNGTTNCVVIGYQKVAATTTVAPEFTGTASGNQAVTGTTSFKLAATGYTVTADAGSHTLTGTAASTEFGREVAAETGSYALSGTDANLEYGYEIVATSGSYALSGQDVSFSRTYEVTVEAGSYSLSGVDAAAELGREIAPEAGSYAVAGQDIGLVYGNTLSTESGSYAVSGADVSLERGYEITAEAGSYALVGQDVSLSAGATLAADVGIYALSGQDVATEYGREISAETGAYSLSGADATLTLTAARTINADAGAYSVSGTDVSLELGRVLHAYSVGPIGLLLTLTYQSGGSYAFAGSDATLTHVVERTLAADSGVYALTGQVANLETGREVLAEAGSYALNGQSAALELGREIAANAGSYAFTGQTAALDLGREIAAEAGSYVLSGQDVAIELGLGFAADAGSYALNGQTSALELGREIAAESGQYAFTGQDASLLKQTEKSIIASPGSYAISGVSTSLEHGKIIVGDTGSYSLTGSDADVKFGTTVTTETGSYSLSGADVGFIRTANIMAVAGSYSLSGNSASMIIGDSIFLENGSYSIDGADSQIVIGRNIFADSGSYLLAGQLALLSVGELYGEPESIRTRTPRSSRHHRHVGSQGTTRYPSSPKRTR